MESQSLNPVAFTGLALAFVSFLIMRLLGIGKRERQQADFSTIPVAPEISAVTETLSSALPKSVVLPTDHDGFSKALNFYWARQECEVIPACVVRPTTVTELSRAVSILKDEHDRRTVKSVVEAPELFAIRSGGHSPVAGAASISGGVVLDLSLLCNVSLSDDEKSVTIGSGARWQDVSKVLDQKRLAVVGGRNCAVRVGGLTLGGGLSFFSPRFGFVCSNVTEFEIVLANGSVTTASESRNPDLWQALKGGGNNFGIVTHFTMPTFPCSKIWSGFLYLPSFQSPRVLAAFHDYLSRVDPQDPKTPYDADAAGPLACFTYLQQLRTQIISVNLVHTKAPRAAREWPSCWNNSRFKSLFRFWSTCRSHTISSATDELTALNPPGRRQIFATTTIANDPGTLAAVHVAHEHAISSLRAVNVNGLSWTLVLQPLFPTWARKGDPNVLGFEDGDDRPLVLVSFTVNWLDKLKDKVVDHTLRETIHEIDSFAAEHGTGHRYRFMNYCAGWQTPFEGYGEENLSFLGRTSLKYDPDGLFQRACRGGFKVRSGGQ